MVVFWVEDNEYDVTLVQTACADMGIALEFVLADDAMQAFRYFDGRMPYHAAPFPPDLLILDLNLPAIKGQVVQEEIRKHHRLCSVPMVVLTSSHDPRELQRCCERGAAECIEKPSTFEGYCDVVRRLLRHLPHREGSGSHPALPGDDGPGDDAPSSRFSEAPTAGSSDAGP